MTDLLGIALGGVIAGIAAWLAGPAIAALASGLANSNAYNQQAEYERRAAEVRAEAARGQRLLPRD